MNIWKVRHEGSPVSSADLSFDQVQQALVDGKFHVTDEVKGPNDADWLKFEDHPAFAELCIDLEPPVEPPFEEEARLDMNALIDVCLVLLIVFILTTTAAALESLLPAPDIQEEDRAKVVPTVNIPDPANIPEKTLFCRMSWTQKDGTVVKLYTARPNPGAKDANDPFHLISMDNLVKDLEKHREKGDRFLLDYDNNVPHGDVVQIIEAAGRAKINRVLIVTKKEVKKADE